MKNVITILHFQVFLHTNKFIINKFKKKIKIEVDGFKCLYWYINIYKLVVCIKNPKC